MIYPLHKEVPMKRMKVKIEFTIEADENDLLDVAEAVRSELSEIVEDEDPLDRRGVSVDMGGDEDEDED